MTAGTAIRKLQLMGHMFWLIDLCLSFSVGECVNSLCIYM